MNNLEAFGLYLRYLRNENNKTTRELASLATISNASISQFENENRKPSLPILKKLASVLSNGNLIEEKNIYTKFLNLLGYEEELSKINSYADELEFQVALSKLIPLEDGLENGFSLNDNPIEPYEQKALNAFIESMQAARKREENILAQWQEQSNKDKE